MAVDLTWPGLSEAVKPMGWDFKNNTIRIYFDRRDARATRTTVNDHMLVCAAWLYEAPEDKEGPRVVLSILNFACKPIAETDEYLEVPYGAWKAKRSAVQAVPPFPGEGRGEADVGDAFGCKMTLVRENGGWYTLRASPAP